MSASGSAGEESRTTSSGDDSPAANDAAVRPRSQSRGLTPGMVGVVIGPTAVGGVGAIVFGGWLIGSVRNLAAGGFSVVAGALLVVTSIALWAKRPRA